MCSPKHMVHRQTMKNSNSGCFHRSVGRVVHTLRARSLPSDCVPNSLVTRCLCFGLCSSLASIGRDPYLSFEFDP